MKFIKQIKINRLHPTNDSTFNNGTDFTQDKKIRTFLFTC